MRRDLEQVQRLNEYLLKAAETSGQITAERAEAIRATQMTEREQHELETQERAEALEQHVHSLEPRALKQTNVGKRRGQR